MEEYLVSTIFYTPNKMLNFIFLTKKMPFLSLDENFLPHFSFDLKNIY